MLTQLFEPLEPLRAQRPQANVWIRRRLNEPFGCQVVFAEMLEEGVDVLEGERVRK
jgi:hypothetical protein